MKLDIFTHHSQILDGKLLASELKKKQKIRVQKLNSQGIYPALGTILVGKDPGSVKYVNGKHLDCKEVGIESIKINLPETANEKRILNAVEKLNQDQNCTGFIVQLPLPKHVDTQNILESMEPLKDADGLHPYNLGSLVLNSHSTIKTPLPCTPLGIITLIEHYLGKNYLEGKHVVVVGRGITVGRSISLLLTRKDINATVTLCHTSTVDLVNICRSADVLISATGSARLITHEYVKKDAVLIDVGVSRDKNGIISGDIDESAIKKSAWHSPNPGGVGPMTRLMLLENIISSCENNL